MTFEPIVRLFLKNNDNEHLETESRRNQKALCQLVEPQGYRTQHVGTLSRGGEAACGHRCTQALQGPEPALVRPTMAC